MKTKPMDVIFNIINYSFMVIFSFLCIYPFIYIAVISFNDANDAVRGGIYFWPRVFSVANYNAIFQNDTILKAYLVTISRVVLSILTQLLMCSLFAYGISKNEFRARKFLNWWIIIPMYFWGGLIPYYIVLKSLGLLNNFFTYIIPVLYNTFNILLLRTSIKEIPAAMEESAKLDGANEPVIFFRIIIPLIKPTLAAITLFIGVGAWNDWYTGFTFISNSELWCAQNILLYLLQSNEASNLVSIAKMRRGATINVTAESVKMAMLIVTTLPVLFIYPFLQKYFVKGIMIGSLKG